ncbi:alpha-(1-_3)-arabinofuranosyltransferase domain-containing protein [Corynebacterium pseudodiphtheriticum]|uniref:alpha-(1->3)-arabinofuranosyltransferase domain-containing protein n=1 Tax=Corynebacterium pseudodiphtheriticum TaxID=37637 RepID=UPI001EE90C52|nr:alpha-(1->3)-arabinofuranosyltransferase family protein [Corynebacterium pseudodiphtheriticum]MDK4207698.1 alpha-(1->3)-arabinofuranosyltransferase family protein [Corynebacterium pseudodiphtheriticum]MDK4285043.1 alpha-(1->3)-arabinofuranosyltransferase family protein [Corynebacterium pseudodiphtheriticum]MDK4318132.1 alpha-(1->3)-arabinofuranosyltransferase family protein [Corynebacterium pseudodiphtheriticum]MDK4339636.1 alpha-(1->3)-arabinofuranosyltransferase family protein [Corynebacte
MSRPAVRARLRIRAHATHPLNTHAIVWLVLATAMFAQPVGLIAADTKHDLTADPAGFLAAATHAWTDVFPLGQLQNQAYGYLFPQGLFFLLADAIPDWLLPAWVAQRLWWTIVAGVGFSGFYRLCQCVVPGSGCSTTASASTRAFQIIAALLFALSPRTLTTLTAISSEAWPVMLAPWVLVPLLRRDTITGRDIAAATIPIALMGAVNATATLAACIPAGLVILWRRQGWLLLPAAVAVSAWWIGPLLVLGKYSPPFTDFIESSYVTTRWLNLLEILRGTTHWTPFADTEREAGYLLVSQPVFVLATVAIAACGLAGLALSTQSTTDSSARLRYHGLWLVMLLVGIAVLAAPYGQLLDDVLAPLRNLHKFDPLVRIPLLLGVANLGAVLQLPASSEFSRRAAAGLGVAVIALLSVAPVWSGRLLPTGAYREVPEYWRQAADFLNDNVDTRTLLVPETSFARQEWGWTRDEPAQPLLDVPWAVRDAVPLLPPEAIRGLDGVLATLDRSVDPLLRLGIGAVLVRHDLDSPVQRERADELADALDRAVENSPASSAVQRHDFGDPDSGGVSVFVLDAQRDMHIAHDPVTVAGGGEALAVLDAIDGPAPRRLVDHAGAGAAKEGSDAEIVTDTPLLVDRNFGTLQGAVSGPLASPDEATTKHPSVDYPSVATPLPVRPRGDVQLQASSSAADATAFGGADPARSINAAVDGTDQAWWPAPGDPGTLQLRSTDGTVHAPELHLTTTEDARLRVLAFADSRPSDKPIHTITVETAAGEDTRVAFPDDLHANRIEVQLNPETRTGVSDIHLAGHELSRLVHVPATANARQFVFQRLAVDTGVVQRSFEVPRTMQLEIRTDDEQPVTIDGTEYSAGETVELSGTHTISTAAAWVSLREPGFAPPARYEPVDGRTVPGAADAEDAVGEGRLLVTGRAFNEGLRGELVDASGTVTELQPTSIDAATQAFVLPAGASGQFRMSFAGEAAYRTSLFVGAAVSLVTLAALVLFPLARPTANTQFAAARRRHARRLLVTDPTLPAWAFPLAAVTVSGAVVGPAGAVSAAAAWAITRWTTIRPVVLAPALLGICGLWLARAPWPDAHYAGDSLLAACLAAGAVACLSQRRAGSSTKV